jgi:small subunit ribosomal protein S20
LANHKSALKRQKQNLVRRARNRANKSNVKNVIRTVQEAIDEKSTEKAQIALKQAIPVIDKCATKGAIHRRNASRKVARLTKRVNTFIAGLEQSA